MTNKITYFSNNSIPGKILHGGHLRFFALSQFVLKNRKGKQYSARIETKYRILNSTILRFIITLFRLIFLSSENILFSYPNFPFFPRKLNKRFSLSTVFLLFVILLKKIKRIKIVVDVDDLLGEAYFCLPERKNKINHAHILFFEKNLFNLADIIFIVSEIEGKIIQRNYSVDKTKFFIAPNGNLRSNMPAKELPENQVKFIYTGTFFKGMKTMDELFNIFNSLNDKNICLYLAGYNGEWIKKEYPSQNIIYLGSLSHAEAEQYTKACDVGVLTYSAEEKIFDAAFPVKMSLYITNDKPILSLDSPTIAGFINQNHVGIVCTLDEFKKNILLLAHDRKLINKLSASCNNIKESLYWDIIFKKAFDYSFGETI